MEAGRPKSFKSAEELEERINHYFNSITITYPVLDTVACGEDKKGKTLYKEIPRLNNAGEQVYRTDYIEIPSIIALCRHLGICRDTWNEYSRQEKFSDTIKIAKERMEQYLEEQLYRKDQVTGIIFNLKNNYGWKDKQEVESTNTNLNLNKDISELSDQELEEELNRLKE